MISRLFILFAATLSLTACTAGPTTGTHIGNPGQVEVVARSALRAEAAPTDALVSQDRDQEPLFISQARVNIRRIELYLPLDVACSDLDPAHYLGFTCDQDEKLVTEGPFVIDLLTGQSSPSLAEKRVPGLTYTRIDYRLDDASHLPASDPLAGHSLLLELSLPEVEPAPFTLALDFSEDARAESPQGITLDEGATLLMALDAALWFDEVELASCLQRQELRVSDGRLDLSAGTGDCDDLERDIKRRIKESGQLDKR